MVNSISFATKKVRNIRFTRHFKNKENMRKMLQYHLDRYIIKVLTIGFGLMRLRDFKFHENSVKTQDL